MIKTLSYITIIGFIGQGLFFSRFLFQLILSEKQQKVVTPSIFWKLSLLASILFFIYGFLREDFAIMLGQSLTFFIYVRNLQLQGEWYKIPKTIKLTLIGFPILLAIYFFLNTQIRFDTFFKNSEIPFWLLILGIVAQIVFVSRFIYQWLYSEKKKESQLPLGFWIISLCGAALILTYAIFREDIVLFLAHSIGMLVYLRNIILLKKEKNNVNTRY